jgi:AAA-like domain
VTVRLEAQSRFFSTHPEQLPLASALDEAFDVTFGNQHGGHFFWICEPKPQVAERFGLQKEVVALYSPHQKTDARTLTQLENLAFSLDFRHRVDKVVALIVHEGDRESSAELLKQANDWVIISIHADELRSTDRGAFFLRSRLAERIGTFDLFGMSSPIKQDKYFYGRDPVVQEIGQRIIVRKESSGIFGLRKTGKTSILFALKRRLAAKNILIEYIDCQGPGIYGSRWWQLLQELSTRISLSLSEQLGRKIRDEGLYDRESAPNSFNRFLKRVIGTFEIGQVVLLLDEIEFITPLISNTLGQHWDEDFVPFWQTIRSTSQELSGGLVFVVAGVNPSSVERPHFKDIQNPIFQLAVPFYLEPLEQPSIRDMVRSIGKYSGFAFSEDCYQYLKDSYGGHPYLIRLACSEVSRAAGTPPVDKKIELTIQSFKNLTSAIRVRLNQPIQDILLSLVWWYPEEYDLLRVLAEGDQDFVLHYLQDNPGNSGQFVRYGLIHESDGTFALHDLRDFLKEHGEWYKSIISPFKRGDLPLEALPEQVSLSDLSALFEKRTVVEVALRKFILMVLGFKFGFSNTLISDHISKSLMSRKGAGDKGQLFVGRSPQDAITELFLSDLKPIFRSNWEDFGPTFDKRQDRFEMNLDTINIARRFEAHAKPLKESDKDEFLNSYLWFHTRLKKVPGLLE